MLGPEAHIRYGRQLLLAEIGEPGQARLCAAHAELAQHADPQAAAVAADYLRRAGLPSVGPAGCTPRPGAGVLAYPVAVATGSEVDALGGGRPELRAAAAALAGALAAVEAVKAIAGAGQPSSVAPEFCLAPGRAR